MQSRWQQRHHGKIVIGLANLVLLRLSLEGDAVHAPSNVPVLPEGQPHPEHHLGSAKDPHAIRLLDEPHRDPTGTLGADHPQPRMLLRSQELYEPIPDRDYRENLYESPLPHSTLHLLFLCPTKSLLSSF